MKNRRFGYISVGSRDQSEGRQLQSKQEVSISPCNIFFDKYSEKGFNREQYKLLKQMNVRNIPFTSIH